MMMIIFLLLFPVLHVSGNPILAVNCTAFSPASAGATSISAILDRIYNTKSALETDDPYPEWFIATNLFEGLKLAAVSGIYSRILQDISNDLSLSNYSGFNNTRIPKFFSQMLAKTTRDICEWLLSYGNGESFTARHNVNCSHPVEETMISLFSMMIPIIEDFIGKFARQFRCPNILYDQWIKTNMESQYGAELYWLDHFLLN